MSAPTIAAIPTMYRGRQYRSRLEARWAAFFDLLGWKHEYEPFDLGTWSPDFLTHHEGATGRFIGVLHEIKPIGVFDRTLAERIARATTDRGVDAILVIHAVAPWIDERGCCCVGWMSVPRIDVPWVRAQIAWIADPDCPQFEAQLWIEGDPFRDGRVGVNYADYTMSVWARASNAAQWRGAGAQP